MLAVKRADQPYAGEVVIWLTRLRDAPVGAALIDRLADRVPDVIIRKPEPTDPPNAWIEPGDAAAIAGGPGCACLVHFDPRDWPSPADPAGRPPDVILYAMLQQAERLQCGGADALHADPSPAMRQDLAAYLMQRPGWQA
jgi:hypothetical protein